MSGVANEIAGSSAPTSGSEHMISHALDSFLERPQLHGVQVGIGTYIMCKITDHRWQRVDNIFTKTGFWDYRATLDLKAEDYSKAIGYFEKAIATNSLGRDMTAEAYQMGLSVK